MNLRNGELIKKLIFFMLACVSSTSVYAVSVEDTIAKLVTPVTGPVEKVTKSQFSDLYEVITPNGIAYTNKTASFVIFGVAIDPKTNTNLTMKRINELSAFKWSELPLQDAVKIVRGNGKRVIATVEDPNCGFCKKLAHELQKLDDVTIYTFIVPVLTPESKTKANAILCADDPSATWTNWMVNNVAPAAGKSCENALDRNLALYYKLHLTGTPAILFKDSTRLPGYVQADKLEESLSEF